MRDLQADLERCQEYEREIELELYRVNYDIAFAKDAREGWPHAIERGLRGENFIRGLNIELANERDKRATAEAKNAELRAEVERLRNENAKLKKALELANSNRMCTECKLLVYCFNKGRHTMPKGCVESWLEQAELEDGK